MNLKNNPCLFFPLFCLPFIRAEGACIWRRKTDCGAAGGALPSQLQSQLFQAALPDWPTYSPNHSYDLWFPSFFPWLTSVILTMIYFSGLEVFYLYTVSHWEAGMVSVFSKSIHLAEHEYSLEVFAGYCTSWQWLTLLTNADPAGYPWERYPRNSCWIDKECESQWGLLRSPHLTLSSHPWRTFAEVSSLFK